MTDNIKIAVDAMGGENSPEKIIEGIKISLETNKNNFFYIYGKKDILEEIIQKYPTIKGHHEVIHANDIIADNESPLVAAKKGKESSMWKAIESQKEKKTDISLSAGNTGAL